jgi:hypothetical protein
VPVIKNYKVHAHTKRARGGGGGTLSAAASAVCEGVQKKSLPPACLCACVYNEKGIRFERRAFFPMAAFCMVECAPFLVIHFFLFASQPSTARITVHSFRR